MAARAPVDDVLAPVDQALFVEPDEDLADRRREPRVHREALALPVAGGAQPLQLADDRAAGLLLPLPDPLDERLAAELLAGRALGRQLPLHHDLGGDAGVVGARQPEGVEPVHPLPAHEDVLERVVQRVADVQGAGDVRRRDDDAVRLRLGEGIGPEVARAPPTRRTRCPRPGGGRSDPRAAPAGARVGFGSSGTAVISSIGSRRLHLTRAPVE